MKIQIHIARNGLRGRAVTKALALDKTDHAAAVKYCKQYADSRKTLPAAVANTAKTNTFVDQIVVHKEFPSEALAAKDIYFMAFPSRAVEYMHCSRARRIAIGVLAQHWTNARINPDSGLCKCHFIVATGKKGHQNAGCKPRCLRFVPFGGTMTKTGRTKVFSWDSVKAQFQAEGIPLR